MLQVHNHHELSARIAEWKRQGKTIAFVPTMGNLHEGHLSLLRIGREQADKLVSSIFVNPLQFAPHEDLDNYPRTLEQDCKALMEHQCDLVYLPSEQDLYPAGLQHMTTIHVPDITERFEGEFRPGHLDGVSTIVLKLFHLVQPDIAVFGKKDYQQWRMIEKMVHDLNLPIDIIAGETVREPDRLAMSSRNQYLDQAQRRRASQLQRQLAASAEKMAQADANIPAIERAARTQLEQQGFKVDYFCICEPDTLAPYTGQGPAVIVAAARLGETRLIDNIEVSSPPGVAQEA